ncbi:hypothetical protein MJ1_0373 [Nanobdella aerobiophila]|uniref:Uncharacterized protein n=1 Tax=Nanobdella aerobiophila TaxID=2586965 RepID=A0A915WST3_9ARCH|nr:hypothetical protein [Nanobdella aerobiophila]BBL45537.1 hypothetical protein MJ1_0373 [Nanobdella aerobiophila]
MTWLERKNIIYTVLKYCKEIDNNKIIRIKNYKEDRWLDIIKKDNIFFEIYEHGYTIQRYLTNFDQLEKVLDKLMKKEFPRSKILKISRYEKN